jgi:hypothetical protein
MVPQHLTNHLLMDIFGMLREPRVVALAPESDAQKDAALAAIRRASKLAVQFLTTRQRHDHHHHRRRLHDRCQDQQSDDHDERQQQQQQQQQWEQQRDQKSDEGGC